MSGDLLIVTPSRGRPVNIARLLSLTHELSRLETHVHVAVDSDDPALEDYQKVFAQHARDGDALSTGDRQGLVAWTNEIAVKRAWEYKAVASFGDDHIPRTRGFDKALVAGVLRDGPGIAYPFDAVREDVPEAPVMDSRIVQALGWFFPPCFSHFYGDQALGDIGRQAGCLRFLRAVAVDHVNAVNGAAVDATYRGNSEKIASDKAAYQVWRRDDMAAAAAAVKAVREQALQPA